MLRVHHHQLAGFGQDRTATLCRLTVVISHCVRYGEQKGRELEGEWLSFPQSNPTIFIISVDLLVNMAFSLCIYFEMPKLESIDAVLLNQVILNTL